MSANKQEISKSVTSYLDALVWDGTSRLDCWLVDCAGAEYSPYVRDVGRLMLVAAVRRVRKPGCVFDKLPVLAGPKNTGKSSALRILAFNDDWFTDDLPLGSDTRRFMESTAGKWIVEVGELKGTGRVDIAALKVCVSRQRDEGRMAYQHKETSVPRQFVIVGTSTDSFFHEATDSRCFLPVCIKRFDLDRLLANRDQLWAEAAEAEALGESIRLVVAETVDL